MGEKPVDEKYMGESLRVNGILVKSLWVKRLRVKSKWLNRYETRLGKVFLRTK